MNRKFLSIMLALSMLCAFMPIMSSAETGTKFGDYLYYEVNADGTAVTITDCDTTATAVDIPSEIEGLPVTSIGDMAFQNCKSITDITIPDCVTNISNYAFNSCESITNITIPDSITNIGDGAFRYCFNLSNINVEESNPAYCSVSGNLFSKDKTTLIQYAIGKTDKSYTIPSEVATIGQGAFNRCKNIESITIPTGVIDIGNQAFYDCRALIEITIPDGVTSIGSSAFGYCTKLVNINVDQNNPNYCSVNGNLFNKDKTTLIQYAVGKPDSSYIIPNTVTSIAGDSFGNGKNLESITIPAGIMNIDYFTFAFCSKLTNIYIPSSITSISYNVFDGCDNFTDVYYTGTEEQWKAISIEESGNDKLLSATIHYNSILSTPTPDPDEPDPSPSASPTPAPNPDVVETSPDTYEIGVITPTDSGVTFTVTTKESVEGKQSVLVACYDEHGVFIGLKQREITPSAEPQTINVAIDKTTTKTVKAFIWNAVSSMMPASRPQSAELQ